MFRWVRCDISLPYGLRMFAQLTVVSYVLCIINNADISRQSIHSVSHGDTCHFCLFALLYRKLCSTLSISLLETLLT
jgi:hypothetical protein